MPVLAMTTAVLHIAKAPDDQVTRTGPRAAPKKLRELAALGSDGGVVLDRKHSDRPWMPVI
jgi:hypothetical protein